MGELTPEEISKIPGHEVLESIDRLSLKVCVRTGTHIAINPDHVKYWKSQPSGYEEAFDGLLRDHIENHAHKLANLCPQSPKEKLHDPESEQVVLVDEAPEKPPEFDSVSALPEAISHRIASEELDVELLTGKNTGSTYLLSGKGKSLPRFAQLGGVGAGKYSPQDASEPGSQRSTVNPIIS
jgi:hypothetical protein